MPFNTAGIVFILLASIFWHRTGWGGFGGGYRSEKLKRNKYNDLVHNCTNIIGNSYAFLKVLLDFP